MTIQANQGFGVSIFGATSAGGGGSTSPGGSSGQIQYNASGSFAGMAGTSWNDTTRSLTLTGATVTTSQPVLNLTQTWNAGAVTFTGLRFNATDTASASGSLLLDLQVGGTSKTTINKAGGAQFASDVYVGYSSSGNYPSLFVQGTDGRGMGVNARIGSGLGFYGIGAGGTPYLQFATESSFSVVTTLRFPAAATLQLGAADAAAPVAQTLQVQSVVAGTSNTAGTNWTLKGSAGTGTGAGGSLIFQVAPAGSSGTAQNAYATALTIDSTKNVTIAGTAVQFGVAGSGTRLLTGAKSLVIDSGNTNDFGSVTASSFLLNSDVILARDAANTLALRNSTNAQTFNVYNTYTDASNYERGALAWTSNSFRITTSAAGTGVSRNIALQSAGGAVDILDGSANSQINFTTTASTGIRVASDRPIGFTSGAANGSNPDTTLRRVAAGILGIRGGAITDAGAVSFIEQTAPAAPAANGVYIYAEDNGSGKTRLMALFNTGAAQQIAIEP